MPDSGAGAPDVPYLGLGAEATASIGAFSSRLDRVFADLGSLLETEAPQLFRELIEKPPAALDSGYQILPEVLPDVRAPTDDSRIFFHAYSWPPTLKLVAERLQQLEESLENPLTAGWPVDGNERIRIWTAMVSEYKRLRDDHEWIDGLIEHNRLWQDQVAGNPALFTRGTELYQLAVDRQRVLDRLAAGTETGTETEAALRRRERELREELEEVGGQTWRPDYLRIESRSAGAWTVVVPLYTDIEDAPFLELFERAVEKYWRYEDSEVSLRIDLVVKPLRPDELYADRLEGPPEPAAAVDLLNHTALFPPDGAVLTTGVEKIHVRGRHILLGPEAVAPRTLAHEFGHVLGFQDSYVRGYRDLTEDGYEILEASPDPEDIMCSSGTGWVLRRHFEVLIATEE